MNSIWTLYKAEFFRSWNRSKIILVGIFSLLFISGAFLLDITGAFDNAEQFPEFIRTQSMILNSILGWLTPLSVFLFAAGIVAFDVKNYWLRSILSRPVTKQEWMLAKIKAISTSVLLTILAIGFIPSMIMYILAPDVIVFDTGNVILILLSYMLEIVLFVSMAAWFSTFLPTFVNVLVLAIMLFIDNTALPLIAGFYWDVTIINFIADFFFPSGFREFTDVYTKSSEFDYEYLLWGFASLALFFGLSLFHINLIKIDKNSD